MARMGYSDVQCLCGFSPFSAWLAVQVRKLPHPENLLSHVVAFHTNRKGTGSGAGALERGLDGPRFVREYGYVVVIVDNRQNLSSVRTPFRTLCNFRPHKERHMVAGICQRDRYLLFAVRFSSLAGSRNIQIAPRHSVQG